MRSNPRLHPVLSQILEKMTELDRRKRPQDLRQIANALAHYREQDVAALEREEEPLDLSDRGMVRKPRARAVSRPAVRDQPPQPPHLFPRNQRHHQSDRRLDAERYRPQTIKPGQLFYLNERIDLKRPIDLNAWLQFQDYGYPRRQSRSHPARCAA